MLSLNRIKTGILLIRQFRITYIAVKMRRKEREITEIAEISSIISRCDVCRIALSDNNIPYIVTMNFGYTGGSGNKLYFHCAGEGKKLEIIRKNNFVCFQFDTDHQLEQGENACDFGMSYRSVVGWGNIKIITEEEEKKRGLNYIMSHYSDRVEFTYSQAVLNRTIVLRLDISEMKGKKC
jgi:hypothetical protein